MKPVIPNVKAQEEEEELVDPQQSLRVLQNIIHSRSFCKLHNGI